jgi:hypothetical protein
MWCHFMVTAHTSKLLAPILMSHCQSLTNLNLDAVTSYLNHGVAAATYLKAPVTENIAPVSCSIQSAMLRQSNKPLSIQFRSVQIANCKRWSFHIYL